MRRSCDADIAQFNSLLLAFFLSVSFSIVNFFTAIQHMLSGNDDSKGKKNKGGEVGGGVEGGVSQDCGVSKETEKLMNCQRSVSEQSGAAREPV